MNERGGRAALRTITAVAIGLVAGSCTDIAGGSGGAFGGPINTSISVEPAGYAAAYAPVSRAQSADAARGVGLTFEDSRLDGDALVLTGVRYPLNEAATATARTVRITGMNRSEDGGLGAQRLEAVGVVIAAPGTDEGPGDGAALARTITVGSLTLDEPVFAAPSAFETLGEDASDADRRRSLAAAMVAFGFRRVNAETLSFADGAASGTVASLRIDGYGGGVLGQVKLGDVAVDLASGAGAMRQALRAASPMLGGLADTPLGRVLTTGADRTTMDTVTWGGLDASGMQRALAAGRRPGLGTDDIVFADLHVRNQTSEVAGKAGQRIARTAISDVTFEGIVPTGVRVSSRGMVTDLTAYAGDAGEEAVGLLTARDLDEIEGSSDSRFDYDPKTGHLSATSRSEMTGFYTASMQMDIAGVADLLAGAMGEDAPSERAAADGVTLNRLTMSITDDRLLETAFELAALNTGQSGMALRQRAVGMVTLGALQVGGVSPRVPDYADAISTFLSEGGTLTINAAPEGGLSGEDAMAAAMTDPASVLEAADLTITRTP